jgi:hypothetical protein
MREEDNTKMDLKDIQVVSFRGGCKRLSIMFSGGSWY